MEFAQSDKRGEEAINGSVIVPLITLQAINQCEWVVTMNWLQQNKETNPLRKFKIATKGLKFNFAKYF